MLGSVHHSALFALLVVTTGCTAIKSTVHLAEAEQALVEARNRDAQNLAVYEYTMAIRYLEKAREENGSADYRMSENLSRRSAEWADKAIIAIERGRRGIDTLEDMGEIPTGPVAPPEDLLPDGALEDLDGPDLPKSDVEEFEDLDQLDDLDE